MDVAIRDAMLPDLEPPEFFRRLRELGVSSIEIEIRPDDSTPALRNDGGTHSVRDEVAVGRLKRLLRDEGVRACAVLVSTDFCSPQVDAHVNTAVRAVRAAHELGAPVVRVDPLVRDKSVSQPDARDAFIRGAEKVLRRTDDTSVDVTMENHGPYANDPTFIRHVLQVLLEPRFGLTLDTGNFYWFGYPLEEVYGLVEKYAKLAKHTHLKSINYPPEVAARRREVGFEYKQRCCPLHEGNLDLRRVVRILRDAGYRRDLCVEDESLFKHAPERRLDVLRTEVEALRQALREGVR